MQAGGVSPPRPCPLPEDQLGDRQPWAHRLPRHGAGHHSRRRTRAVNTHAPQGRVPCFTGTCTWCHAGHRLSLTAQCMEEGIQCPQGVALLASLAQDSHSRGGEGGEDWAKGQAAPAYEGPKGRKGRTDHRPATLPSSLPVWPGRCPLCRAGSRALREDGVARGLTARVAPPGLGRSKGHSRVGSVPGPRCLLPNIPTCPSLPPAGMPWPGCWSGGWLGPGGWPERRSAVGGSLEGRGARATGQPG